MGMLAASHSGANQNTVVSGKTTENVDVFAVSTRFFSKFLTISYDWLQYVSLKFPFVPRAHWDDLCSKVSLKIRNVPSTSHLKCL